MHNTNDPEELLRRRALLIAKRIQENNNRRRKLKRELTNLRVSIKKSIQHIEDTIVQESNLS